MSKTESSHPKGPSAGGQGAPELFPKWHTELRKLAAALMEMESSNHTLQPTALVNEAWLRLAAEALSKEKEKFLFQDKEHFMRIVARTMRRILVEHARRKLAAKRGVKPQRIDLDEIDLSIPEERCEQYLNVDEAMEELAVLDARMASGVEMRFFGGFTAEEVAGALGVSVETIHRDWKTAKAWLFQVINAKNAAE